MKLLIQNGTVVTESGILHADLLAEDGVISRIGDLKNCPADRILDASGCIVLPGFIDTHTHLDLPLATCSTADDFPSGTAAALLGGTTTVLDFATQDRGMTMQQALDTWHKKAEGSSCHYGFHMAISEWSPAIEKEIPAMVRQGVTSFKMYMVYDAMKLDDGAMYDALRSMYENRCIAGVHCENYDVLQQRIRDLHEEGRHDCAAHALSRPAEVEAEAVGRLMRIAELAGTPVWVVHLSTKEGLEEVRRARHRGQKVLVETCPQYLVLTDDCYEAENPERFIMSPPLRKDEDRQALLNALSTGEVDVIGTDHCSFTMEQKRANGPDFTQIPNGGAGIQNRAALFHMAAVSKGFVGYDGMANLLSSNAAKLFGLYPRKGVIREGSDADLVIFDPNAPAVITAASNAHRCDNSPYEGIRTPGSVRDVVLSGEVAVEGGRLVKPGLGKYLERGFSSLAESRSHD